MADVDEAPKLLRIRAELVYRFFAAFSRFEYALKRSGFIGKGPDIRIEECWSLFAQTARIEKRFGEVCAEEKASADAVAFLTANPPMKQRIGSDGLMFEDVKEGQTGLLLITVWLRRIRNNLFHGGKFPVPLGPFDPVRDERLVESALEILGALLKCDAGLRHAFLEPA